MKQHQRSGVLCKTHNTNAYSVKNVANLESKLKSVGYVLLLVELSEKFQLKTNLRIRFESPELYCSLQHAIAGAAYFDVGQQSNS